MMEFSNRRIAGLWKGLTPKRGFKQLGSIDGFTLWLSHHPNAWSYPDLEEPSAERGYVVWGLGRQDVGWIEPWVSPEADEPQKEVMSLLRYVVVALDRGGRAPHGLIKLGELEDAAFYLHDRSTGARWKEMAAELQPHSWVWVGEQVRVQDRRRRFDFEHLAYEPTYHDEVIFLFGRLLDHIDPQAEIEYIQASFPDCRAARFLGKEHVRIEFEVYSSRFDHPVEGCDYIVCWEHDWAGCPLPVISVREVVEKLGERAI